MRRHGRPIIATGISVCFLFLAAFEILAVAPANEHFQRTWARTDKPVADGQVSRTWMWGPEAFTGAIQEPYLESPSGKRWVQYFDKSRMEITDPEGGDPASIWYVTNGLLVVELVTGDMHRSAIMRSSRVARRWSMWPVMPTILVVPPTRPLAACLRRRQRRPTRCSRSVSTGPAS